MSLNNIATLDIEASGIHPDSYPIEIGILLGNGDSYCSLIKPDPTWTYWSESAQHLHGITRENLRSHGKPIKQIAEELNSELDKTTIYSDCWVLDNSWLIKLFEFAKIQPSFTLRDIMYKLKEEEYYQLSEIKQQVEEELQIQRHRATNDARILQLAYERIKTCKHPQLQ